MSTTDDFELNMSRIVTFLDEIGIEVRFEDLDDGTFLPGVEVVSGRIVVDRRKLLYPGDLLHEAGHLAVAPREMRGSLSGEVVVPDVNPDVLEVVTMLWSYAAAIHLEIDPAVVFHDGGYKGHAAALLMNFSLGLFPTVQILEEFGMTYSQTTAAGIGAKPFPVMRKWLRD